jgi:16S rRNA (cytosine1402-N4)-methyltransferase
MASSSQPEARGYHRPVMLAECIDGLQIKSGGIYVDATFGGGGHSMKMLENIREGKLIAFDQDEDARKEAEKIQSRAV